MMMKRFGLAVTLVLLVGANLLADLHDPAPGPMVTRVIEVTFDDGWYRLVSRDGGKPQWEDCTTGLRLQAPYRVILQRDDLNLEKHRQAERVRKFWMSGL